MLVCCRRDYLLPIKKKFSRFLGCEEKKQITLITQALLDAIERIVYRSGHRKRTKHARESAQCGLESPPLYTKAAANATTAERYKTGVRKISRKIC